MILDEVYQAALAAGSGGIRYNSTIHKIQLMDENKNWVDYRNFNPDKTIQNMFILSSWGGSTSRTFSCPHSGYYFALAVTLSSSGTGITSTGAIEYFQSINPSKFAIINANEGDTITISSSGSGTGPNAISIYYVSNINSFSGVSFTPVSSAEKTFRFDNGNANCIFGISASYSSYSTDFVGDNYSIDTLNTAAVSIFALPDSEYGSIVFTGTSFIVYCTVE